MKAGNLRVMASRFKLTAVGGVPKTVQRVRGMFFGWYMAGLGAALMAMASAPLWHGLPVWSPVLRNAFDWTTVQMSWAFAVTRVEGGLLGPLEGLLVQRLGTRRVVFIGLTVLGTGLVLFSRIEELWQLYAAFFIMSLGAALSTWLPIMTLTNHWFVRHKARAMSIVLEGFAIGGVVVPLLLAWAIGGTDPEITERYGWRNTALLLGLIIVVLAFPLTRLIRNRPEDMGLMPDGDLPNEPAPAAAVRADAEVGLRQRAHQLRQADGQADLEVVHGHDAGGQEGQEHRRHGGEDVVGKMADANRPQKPAMPRHRLKPSLEWRQ